MKAKEVLELLDISRVTLWSYLKKGKIKATKMENNNYDEESVYKLLGKMYRKDVIYARVSTSKQKKDLFNQIKHLENFVEKLDIKNYDRFSAYPFTRVAYLPN